jgi:hypothetical protein
VVRVLKSNHEIAEVRFPALPVVDAEGHPQRDELGNERVRLPEVVLPRSIYTASERARGKLSYIVLDDAAQARLHADQSFRQMLRRGNYELLPEGVTQIPLEALPEEQRREVEVRQLQQQNARLRSELRKNGLPIPEIGEPPAPVATAEDLAATDVSVPDPLPTDPGAMDVGGPMLRGKKPLRRAGK